MRRVACTRPVLGSMRAISSVGQTIGPHVRAGALKLVQPAYGPVTVVDRDPAHQPKGLRVAQRQGCAAVTHHEPTPCSVVAQTPALTVVSHPAQFAQGPAVPEHGRMLTPRQMPQPSVDQGQSFAEP